MKRLKQLLISSLILGGVFYCNQTWAGTGEELYLVGDATVIAWSSDGSIRQTTRMTETESGVYVWTGWLKHGDQGLKIVSSPTGWDGYHPSSASFAMGESGSDVYTTNNDADYKWNPTNNDWQCFTITLNTNNETFSWEPGVYDVLTPGIDGYISIGTAEELNKLAFMYRNNINNIGYKVKLTADIDYTAYTNSSLSSLGISQTYPFRGEFDGQGHTITIALTNAGSSRTGLFAYINAANIKNLVVEGSATSAGNNCVGGLGGRSDDNGTLIENVVVKTAVSYTGSNGDATCGGFFANMEGTVTLKNCAFYGSINTGEAQGNGGLVGWAESGDNNEYINCIVAPSSYTKNGDSEDFARNNPKITNCQSVAGNDAKLASGEMTYILNGNSSDDVAWFQKIGTDTYPMPFGTDVVYAVDEFYCDGTSKGRTYSNTNESVRNAHNWNEWGFCTNSHDAIPCNELQPDFMTPDGEGYYLIGTKQQLNWFAHKVNGYKSVAASYDINGKLTADIDFSDQAAMIGGDGNSVAYRGTFDGQGHKVTLGYNVSQHNVALFRTIANANIKNLITDGTIRNESGSCAGGIFGGSHGASVVENCVSYVTLSRTAGGDATFGGIGAYMHDTGKIKNCAFYGSIITPEAEGNGGLLGYANGGNNIAVENCIVNATEFTFNPESQGSGKPVSVARNTGTVNNTYVVSAGSATQNEAQTARAEQLASGELAFIINSESKSTVWHQTIGTDRHPYPFSGDHMVVSKDNDDYYNGSNLISIASGSELNTFATNYNNGMYAGACKVKLTSDLDMYGISYPGIGVDSHYFVGVLDGQGYIISNLSMRDINHDNIGFINAAKAPSTIRNLTLDNTCTIPFNVSDKQYVGGIMGACFGNGIVSFYNCGNEAAITANKNPGGILGCNLSGGVTIQMKNCYNTGAIIGKNTSSEGGGISGWLGNNSVLTNCYSTGSVTYGEAFARGNSATVINCYTLETSGGGNRVDANYTKTTVEFADGTVLGELAEGTDGSAWHIGFSGGTAHPVVNRYVELSENYNNSVQDGSDVDVSLYRTIKQGGWNTFCVPFNMSSAQITDYFGAGTEVAVLDESKNGLNDDVLHFKLVDEIEAGQAYLVYPGVDEDFSSKAIEDVTISATSPQVGITQAGFTFKGVYVPTALDAAVDRIVVSGNKIVKTTGGSLNGFRAYFKPTGDNARATRFVIDDDNEVTGIITAEGEVIMDQPVYNLRGQRVQEGNSSSRGLLIKGGKKYVKM